MSTAAGTVRHAVPAFATTVANPRHDKRFADFWLLDLAAHLGEWRHPRCVAPNAGSFDLCTAARDACERFTRWGWVIESGPQGYRAVDYHAPERVYLLRPGGPRHEEAEEMPGQLRLAEGV